MSNKPFPFDVCKKCCGDEAAKTPYIGENGNWYQYDNEKCEFVDTGVSAQSFGDSALYSNAIKGSASGYMLSLDDISPFEHEIGVGVRSKNLLPYPYKQTTKTSNGVTFTDNGDGSITANGTATGTALIQMFPQTDAIPFPAGTYTLTSGISEDKSGTTYGFQIGITIDGVRTALGTENGVKTFVAEKDCLIDFLIVVRSGQKVENLIFYPQIEKGPAATDYVPHIDVSQLSAIKTGKNMASFNGGKSFTKTENGLTIDYDAELQLFTLNGTLSSYDEFCFGSLFDLYGYSAYDGKEQTLSLIYEGGSVSNEGCELYVVYGECHRQFGDMVTGASVKLAEKSTSNTAASHYGVNSYFEDLCMSTTILDDVTFTDYKFKLQLETGNGTEYEPAKAEKFSLAESTEFATMSHTPTTNICVQNCYDDNSMMVILPIIDCKYNQNINSVIEKLTQAIISLGGLL